MPKTEFSVAISSITLSGKDYLKFVPRPPFAYEDFIKFTKFLKVKGGKHIFHSKKARGFVFDYKALVTTEENGKKHIEKYFNEFVAESNPQEMPASKQRWKRGDARTQKSLPGEAKQEGGEFVFELEEEVFDKINPAFKKALSDEKISYSWNRVGGESVSEKYRFKYKKDIDKAREIAGRMIAKSKKQSDFNVGDKVLITTDAVPKIQAIDQKHKDRGVSQFLYTKFHKDYEGTSGEITQVAERNEPEKNFYKVKVANKGVAVWWYADALRLVGKAEQEEQTPVFKKGDRVRFRADAKKIYQIHDKKWDYDKELKERTIATVYEHSPDINISLVMFDGEKDTWQVFSLALELVSDEKPQKKSHPTLGIGDKVMLRTNAESIFKDRSIKTSASWSDSLNERLGKSGEIVEDYGNNNYLVRFDSDKVKFGFPIEALVASDERPQTKSHPILRIGDKVVVVDSEYAYNDTYGVASDMGIKGNYAELLKINEGYEYEIMNIVENTYGPKNEGKFLVRIRDAKKNSEYIIESDGLSLISHKAETDEAIKLRKEGYLSPNIKIYRVETNSGTYWWYKHAFVQHIDENDEVVDIEDMKRELQVGDKVKLFANASDWTKTIDKERDKIGLGGGSLYLKGMKEVDGSIGTIVEIFQRYGESQSPSSDFKFEIGAKEINSDTFTAFKNWLSDSQIHFSVTAHTTDKDEFKAFTFYNEADKKRAEIEAYKMIEQQKRNIQIQKELKAGDNVMIANYPDAHKLLRIIPFSEAVEMENARASIVGQITNNNQSTNALVGVVELHGVEIPMIFGPYHLRKHESEDERAFKKKFKVGDSVSVENAVFGHIVNIGVYEAMKQYADTPTDDAYNRGTITYDELLVAVKTSDNKIRIFSIYQHDIQKRIDDNASKEVPADDTATQISEMMELYELADTQEEKEMYIQELARLRKKS